MSLLTPELRARIGETRVYTAPEPLSRAAIRYYACAVGDGNPIYTDEVAARAAGWPGLVAPPTLLTDTNQYMRGERDEDGFLGHSWHLDVPGTRVVRGGNDYRFQRPARPDDIVTVTWQLTDIAERHRSDGRSMLVVLSSARIVAADGEPILTNLETILCVPVGSVS